jgi:anti-sigma factor RsiW
METPRQEKSKRYLLGKLSQQETAEFEAQCFDDDDLFHETVDLENDLVHSYLRGELSQAERQEFEAGYLISPARRQKLEFAKALEQRLFKTDGAPVSSQQDQLPASRPARVDFAIRGWRMRLVSGAVALAAIATISWLVITNHRLNSELGQMRAEQVELRRAQQELEAKIATLTARLQESVSGSHGQQPFPHTQPPGPDVMAFNLTPGLPRSAATIKQLVVPPGVRLVELKLYLEEDKYSSYRALLETLEGKPVRRKDGLKSHADSEGRPCFVFYIPSDLLDNGDYLVKLDGVAGTGEVEENISAYRFLVARR